MALEFLESHHNGKYSGKACNSNTIAGTGIAVAAVRRIVAVFTFHRKRCVNSIFKLKMIEEKSTKNSKSYVACIGKAIHRKYL